MPPTRIDSFTGEHAFCSNFYDCPVIYEGILYRSSEHAYQAAKFLDPEKRKVFSMDFNPRLTASQAKKLGRTIKPLRGDWEQVKVAVMREILLLKFAHEDMKARLLATGIAELVEGNWWHDTFWGVCDGSGRHLKCHGHEPYGDNNLGKLLMEVRTLLEEPFSHLTEEVSI